MSGRFSKRITKRTLESFCRFLLLLLLCLIPNSENVFNIVIPLPPRVIMYDLQLVKELYKGYFKVNAIQEKSGRVIFSFWREGEKEQRN